MPVKEKPRKLLLRVVSILGVVLAVLLAVLLHVSRSAQITQTTTEAPTMTTSVATEVILPPPEANPYGPADFQYNGRYLTCLAGESQLGIDVSAHQQEIDWGQVARAGIRFAMIRVGYRGYESGDLVRDQYAQRNYEGAKAAGLEVGVYFFSQAVTEGEALEEAQFLLDAIQGWELALPVVYDWEYISREARTGNADKRMVTDCSIAFCEAVESAGYAPMIYFNRHQAQDFLYLEELTAYPFWLALYSDRMTYPYRVQMWQYTQTGYVPGIVGAVDINLWLS